MNAQKTYNTNTKTTAKFVITFVSAFDGTQRSNHYVTRKAAEKNLQQLKLAGHTDIVFTEV